VGKTQTEENYAYHHGTESEKKTYGARMVDVFYVQTDGWRRNVARRGLVVFKQVTFDFCIFIAVMIIDMHISCS